MILLEVPYMNGSEEFVNYLHKSIQIKLPKDYTENEYTEELAETYVDTESYSYIKKSNKEFQIKIYKENDKYYIRVSSETPLNNLDVVINYVFLDQSPKRLYSIDYDNGVIHFSEELVEDYKINYQYSNLLVTGKKSEQLSEEQFNFVNDNVNIKNYIENSSVSFLYKKTREEHRNITPILKNLKVNYILKDAISL